MTARSFVEILRRLLLCGGVAAAGFLYFLTGFEPLVTVALPQVPKATSTLPEEGLTEELVSGGAGETVASPRIEVSGDTWEKLFTNSHQSFKQNMPIPGWEHRIFDDELRRAAMDNQERSGMDANALKEEAERVALLKAQYGFDTTFHGSFFRLYFKAGEPPFDELTPMLTPYADTLLDCGGCDGPLRVELRPAHVFTGFHNVVSLPQAFSYPWRDVWFWPALAGLVAYLLLPWRRASDDAIAYQRWRLVVVDIVYSFIGFGVFFVLPLAVIGGSVEALINAPWFAALFWMVASIIALGIGWSAWAAVYQLTISRESIHLTTMTGHRDLRYDGIEAVEPIILKPPLWLIRMSWLAIFLGRGAAQIAGQTGRAMMLAGSEANGLRLRGKGGGGFYIWFSNEFGGSAKSHYDRMIQDLRVSGVAWSPTEETVRAIFPPSFIK